MTLSIAAGAARAGIADPAEEWYRIWAAERPGDEGSLGAIAARNHRALGRLLVVLHLKEGAPALPFPEEIGRTVAFLERSKIDWIAALRKASWLVLGKPANGAALEVIDTDGSTAVTIPLPAKDEEIADKLRGRLYKRAEPDGPPKFEARIGPALDVSFAPPEGWRFVELGLMPWSICILEGPEGRRAYLGADVQPRALGAAEDATRAALEDGNWGRGEKAKKLSKPQHAGSGAAAGTFKATFETERGEKGAGAFEVVKNAGVLWAVVVGKTAPEKEAQAFLARWKQSLKKEKG